MTILPGIVARITNTCDAWIIGSAAEQGIDLSKVTDFDILVPLSEWRLACVQIPKDAKVNTFGGWKVTDNGIIIDIWPDDLGSVFTHSRSKFAWHPRSGTRIIKLKGDN